MPLRLTRVVLDKGPLNGCVCVCVCDNIRYHLCFSCGSLQACVMDSDALLYCAEVSGGGCEACVVQPVSAVKLLYKDCLLDANKQLVTS